MKQNHKNLLTVAAVAVIASASTMVAMKATGFAASSPAAPFQADVTIDSPNHGIVPVASRGGVPTDFTQAAESTINGVVSIKSYVTPRRQRNRYYGNQPDMFNDPFFEFFFGSPRQQPRRQQPAEPEKDGEEAQQQLGLGSGVIVTSDGYIVTNNHVIDGADRLEVTLNDNRTFNARVIGTDDMTDLALIKISANELPVIPMGDSDALKVGEWVLAVGNPFGLTSTVTAGIVSAKARSISDATHAPSMGVESYIQTDAAVNPGNSGGALVNLNGELVGINTAIYSQTGNYAGHSFAIPASLVNKIIGDIKQYGAVQRAFIGITFQPLTAKLAKEKDITAVNSGIYVVEVQPNSAAEDGGIKPGDVITAINGVETTTDAQLRGQINCYSPGDQITVDYYRNNKKQTATVKLLNRSGSTTITRAGDSSELGCTFGEVKEETLKELRISSGVEVTKLTDGLFKSAGIKTGYIITAVNQQPVTSGKDIEKLYKAAMQSDNKVLFITGVYPTGKRTAYAVNLDE